MRLYEKYRPKTLSEVVGQPAIGPLKQFVAEPYPAVQNDLKESLEEMQRDRRVIVIATSNDASRLPPAL